MVIHLTGDVLIDDNTHKVKRFRAFLSDSRAFQELDYPVVWGDEITRQLVKRVVCEDVIIEFLGERRTKGGEV